MQHIKSPREWIPFDGQPGVFLAGGITGCPNWQKAIAGMLQMTNYAVLNPRRDEFKDSPEAAELQIRWEFEHLRKADVIAFWFCKEQIQPIALFELGVWSTFGDSSRWSPKLIIGVEPGYPRGLDIRIQMKLLKFERILTSLEDLANEIRLVEPNLSPRLSNKAHAGDAPGWEVIDMSVQITSA